MSLLFVAGTCENESMNTSYKNAPVGRDKCNNALGDLIIILEGEA